MIRTLIVASVLCFPSFAEATGGQAQVVQRQRVAQRNGGFFQRFAQRFRGNNNRVVVKEQLIVRDDFRANQFQQFSAHQFQRFQQQRFYAPPRA